MPAHPKDKKKRPPSLLPPHPIPPPPLPTLPRSWVYQSNGLPAPANGTTVQLTGANGQNLTATLSGGITPQDLGVQFSGGAAS